MSDEEREFIGFFAGEGCMYIHTTKTGNRITYEPVFKINLRKDDFAVLKRIQELFGGSIYYEPKRGTRNDTASWILRSVKGCLKIITLLEKTKLPFQKNKQLSTMKEFLLTKQNKKRENFNGNWYSEEVLNKQKEYQQSLRTLKQYSIS